MDKPGDQKGGAAQTINCSCVVVYISEAYARRNFPNTFVGLPPLIRPAAPFTAPIIPQQFEGFRYANTFEEAKEISKNIINQNTVLKVDSTKFGSNLTLSQLNRYNEQINKLSLEYKLAPYLDESSKISLQFASSNKYLGFVQPAYNKIQTINFGDKYDKVSRTIPRVEINQFGGKRFAGKSKVDSENVEISTVTHEFAHVIVIESAGDYGKYPEVAMFWKELKSLMTKYRKDVKAKVSTNDWVGLDQIYLGDYANTNRNEFMAEGFTEYKLSSNPSKYAIEIGQLIDKYFKK